MGEHTGVAVISGGNRGIGLAIARQLGTKGIHVVLGSRKQVVGDGVAAELRAEGISAEAVALNVTQARSVSALASHMANAHGGFDILVNNAGVSLQGFDADVVRDTFAVNYYGALDLTDALMPHIRKEGRVVNISSGVANRAGLNTRFRDAFGDPNLDRDGLEAIIGEFTAAVAAGEHRHLGWPSSAYRISKLALNEMTRFLAKELADDPRGIQVNSACPGWVRTRMGGPSATVSPTEGADTAVWLALKPAEAPTGGFFRERASIPW